LFNTSNFTIENRQLLGQSQELGTVAKKLSVSPTKIDANASMKSVSDFHLLCFIHGMGILSEVCQSLSLLGLLSDAL